jgi:hypothetical protein
MVSCLSFFQLLLDCNDLLCMCLAEALQSPDPAMMLV